MERGLEWVMGRKSVLYRLIGKPFKTGVQIERPVFITPRTNPMNVANIKMSYQPLKPTIRSLCAPPPAKEPSPLAFFYP